MTFLSCVLSFYLSLGPYLFWDRYLFKKEESMNNEMISQLQFDQIKRKSKQEQSETIAKTNQ